VRRPAGDLRRAQRSVGDDLRRSGYATVNVNIRGTGCSGGAFDFFETMQLLDGYDVIETVAAQPGS
jgi:predicted acyl esterase